jgi:hypothetical protein
MQSIETEALVASLGLIVARIKELTLFCAEALGDGRCIDLNERP